MKEIRVFSEDGHYNTDSGMPSAAFVREYLLAYMPNLYITDESRRRFRTKPVDYCIGNMVAFSICRRSVR